MDNIVELFSLDIPSIIVGIFVILSAVIAMYEVIGKFSVVIGKPVKWMRQRTIDHELLKKTIKDLECLRNKQAEDTKQATIQDELIKKDLTNVSEIMLQIKDEVTLMRTQRDNDKLAEYKDKIGESYRFYCSREYSDNEPVPFWNHMEKEALEGLITQYEAHGGRNSFVHSVVEPKMQTWKVID